MEPIIRALLVYGFLLLIFRISGARLLSQMTSFDLVLLLIISETTQQAMVDSDHSIANCFLLVMTLVGASAALLYLKQRSPALDRWLDGQPVIVLNGGKLEEQAMKKAHVDKADILESARLSHGLERLDQIKFAIVERTGEISIIPAK